MMEFRKVRQGVGRLLVVEVEGRWFLSEKEARMKKQEISIYVVCCFFIFTSLVTPY